MTLQKTVQDQKNVYPYSALPEPGSTGMISARSIRAPLPYGRAAKVRFYFYIGKSDSREKEHKIRKKSYKVAIILIPLARN